MAADRFQKGHVDRGKRGRTLVQHLGYPNDLVGAVAQGDAQNASSAISGNPVYLRIEPCVLIRVVDDFGGPRTEHRTGNPDALRYSNLRHAVAVSHPREQLAG